MPELIHSFRQRHHDVDTNDKGLHMIYDLISRLYSHFVIMATRLCVFCVMGSTADQILLKTFTGLVTCIASQIAKFMGPTWGPPGSYRPQMGPMLAPRTLLSGLIWFPACHKQLSFGTSKC